MFVEVAARTHFSFLRGGSHPRAIVERAVQLGYDAVGVADCDGLYGIVRALEAADELGIRLVVGCEVALDGAGPPGARGPLPHVWLHVASSEGYRNLCAILTESHARHPKGKPRGDDEGVPRNQFAGLPIDRVCANAGGLWCLAPPPDLGADGAPLPARDALDAGLRALKDAFGDRLSIAAWRHLDGDDDARVAAAEAIARAAGAPVCATNRVLFAEPRRQARLRRPPLHPRGRHARRGGARAPAQRRGAPASAPAAMARLFADHPAWLARTRDDRRRAAASRCASSTYRFPCELDAPAFPGETPDEALRRLTDEGARAR